MNGQTADLLIIGAIVLADRLAGRAAAYKAKRHDSDLKHAKEMAVITAKGEAT